MSGQPQHRMNPKTVLVTCWCEDSFVWVPQETVNQGQTLSCRRLRCYPLRMPDRKAPSPIMA